MERLLWCVAVVICLLVAFWANFGFTLVFLWAFFPSPPIIQTFPLNLSYRPYRLSTGSLKFSPPIIGSDDDIKDLDVAVGFADLRLNHSAYVPDADESIGSRWFFKSPRNALDSVRGYPLEFVIQFEANIQGLRREKGHILDTPPASPVDLQFSFYNSEGDVIVETYSGFFPQGAQISLFQERIVNAGHAIFSLLINAVVPHPSLRKIMRLTDESHWQQETVVIFHQHSWESAMTKLGTARFIRLVIQPAIPFRGTQLVVRIKPSNWIYDLVLYNRWIWTGLASITMGIGAAIVIVIATIVIFFFKQDRKNDDSRTIKQE